MSAIISMGNTIPVDSFAPKTDASTGTTNIPNPEIPAFDMPIANPQKSTHTHCVLVRSNWEKISIEMKNSGLLVFRWQL